MLDVGCAKGFLVNDFNVDLRVGSATGLDISLYALLKGQRDGMKGTFYCSNAIEMPFFDKEFSIVFCKDSLHNILDREELVQALKEIERVSKNAWIRVGAYVNNDQKMILDKWATFATSYFHTSEWKDIFAEAGYTGDYDWFHPSCYIND